VDAVDQRAERAESSQAADMDLTWKLILVVLPYNKVAFLK
jgi:hypothetical protein